MKKSKRTTLWVLFVFITISLQFVVSTVEEHNDDDQDESPSHPPTSEVIAKMLSMMNDSHQSYWEKIKAVIGYLQEQFLPPNLKGMDETKTMGEKAEKVAEKSEDTFTESVVDAKETVKERGVEKDESAAEL